MSEQDLSSCSYLTDAESPEISEKDAVIRDLQYTQQRLENENKNLLSSIEGLKQQLKDTLVAMDLSDSIKIEIQNLKKENTELLAKNSQMEEHINAMSAEGNDATKKMFADISKIQAEKEETLLSAEKLKERVSELKKERNQLKIDQEEKSELLQAVSEDLQKYKQYRKKAQQKISELSEQYSLAEAEIEKLNMDIQLKSNENSTLLSENDSLKLKIDAMNKIHEDTLNEMKQLKKEIGTNNTIITTLEGQVAEQGDEIRGFSDERFKLLETLQSAQRSLVSTETVFDDLMKENALLKQKTKSFQKTSQKPFATIQDFNNIIIPFADELKSKCQSIMKLQQYQPFQRVQLVLNEAAKYINEQNENIVVATRSANAANSSYENFTRDQIVYREILEALIAELKNLATNQDLINGCVLCKEDGEFLDFMDSKVESFSNLYQRESIKDQQYISNDFFSLDVTKRKEAVRKLLHPCDSTFSLFCAQFLINIFLERQLESVTAPLQLIDNMTKSGVLRGTQLSDVPRLIETLNANAKRTETQNKKLKVSVKKLQTQNASLGKSENEKKLRISELENQVDKLQCDIGVLNLKLQVANNELELKQKELGNLDKFTREIREGVEEQTNDQNQRSDRLEKELQLKTKECAELSKLLHTLEKTIDENSNSQIRRSKKNQEMLIAQLEVLQNQVDEYESMIVSLKQANKNTRKTLQEQYNRSVQELTERCEAGRLNLEETINSLKDKMNKSNEISQQLINKTSELESRNAAIQNENNDLTRKLKTVQAELSSNKNNLAKERQQLQAHLTAQLMAAESRTLKLINDEKSKHNVAMNEMIQKIYEHIGTFYGIDESEFNNNVLEQIVKNAREDLEKLQYFQKEDMIIQ